MINVASELRGGATRVCHDEVFVASSGSCLMMADGFNICCTTDLKGYWNKCGRFNTLASFASNGSSLPLTGNFVLLTERLPVLKLKPVCNSKYFKSLFVRAKNAGLIDFSHSVFLVIHPASISALFLGAVAGGGSAWNWPLVTGGCLANLLPANFVQARSRLARTMVASWNWLNGLGIKLTPSTRSLDLPAISAL